jgi:hypothetical protein
VTSPWEDPGPDPAVLRILRRRTPEVGHEPSLLRDPARVLIVAGGIVAIVASPLPWLVKVGGGTPRTMTGWSGLADGFLVAVVAATMIAVVLHGDVARSRAWVIRWLAPMLGVVAVVLGISALRNMENQTVIWSIEGATGDHQPWLYVCLAGIVFLAVGAVLMGLRLAHEPAPAGSDGPVTVPWATIAWVVLGTVGGILGVVAAATIVLHLDIHPVAVSLPLLIGTILGGIVGAHVGAALARVLVGR